MHAGTAALRTRIHKQCADHILQRKVVCSNSGLGITSRVLRNSGAVVLNNTVNIQHPFGIDSRGAGNTSDAI
ncbi:hypothetical protein KR52_06235 [Synechococcus sp. KORDI-52]|nr:hypothetical protein KR52_06235 [Synechococcus sp. KORDI-52]